MDRSLRPALRLVATLCGLALLVAACAGEDPGAVPRPPEATLGAAATGDATAQQRRDRRIELIRRSSAVACNSSHRFNSIRTGAEPLCAPFDSVPAVDDPVFVAPGEGEKLQGDEPVVAVSVAGDARAYPVRYLIFHEVVNDEVGGVPIVVTFCPLCNSAVAHERVLDGQTLTFGVSGRLAYANLVMFDRETASFWHQLTGRASSGVFEGRRLMSVPVQVVSYRDWLEAHPDGAVLQPPDSTAYPYGTDPYGGYDVDPTEQSPVLQHSAGPVKDTRLPPKWRVVGAVLGNTPVAFPMPEGHDGPVVREHIVDGAPLVAFFEHGTIEAETNHDLSSARRGWSGSVWRAQVDGRQLSFDARGADIYETTTGSTFNILGVATSGERQGFQLEGVQQLTSFWFSWTHFFPDTLVLGNAQ